MITQMRNAAAIAAIATAAAFAAPQPAQAQSVSYCNGRLIADSFYNTVSSNGRTSTVSYFLQLRNTTNARVNYTLTFNATQAQQRPVNAAKSLNAYASERIRLGVDTFNNPSGTGALQFIDLRDATQITCR